MTERRRASKADPFEVWGKPPEIILDQLGKRDHDRLRRYVDRIASKVYRLAYDLGAASASAGECAPPSKEG